MKHAHCTSLPEHPFQDIRLESLRLFSGCTPAFLAELKAAMRMHDYAKDHVIFMQDDLAEWFYVVQSGWIKLFRQMLDGDEVIIDILPAGHIFGEMSPFENGVYSSSAEVVQDSRVAAFPIALLKAELDRTPAFARAMLHHIAGAHAEREKEIEHRTIQSAPQRLGCFLLRLIRQKDRRAGPISLHLPYDKKLIASRLGMKAETFSRALARLKEDVSIDVHGATVTISSLDALVSYTCSACSNSFPCED